ncbi:hypothetical protein FKG94_08485 [Exilibacterium tricleocarpae]|uniref:Uncharacterized protein n=1 Tax=Exilibacterium tricleocarpae TaxID=2591008 RepID=A0A545TV92_9GAMM|nr:hypothetical protein [Exilibacterium tricleocarpae]TQV81137.1 hypothetical protein FKG94_08485 [Exilibacterium tricleocarpae]
MKILVTTLLLLIANGSQACNGDQGIALAERAKHFVKYYDYVAQVRLSELGKLTEQVQLATFEVIHTYKGNESKTATIENRLNTSCSKEFLDKGEIYYVFAKLGVSNYKITGGTFASERRLKAANIEFNP